MSFVPLEVVASVATVVSPSLKMLFQPLDRVDRL
jgi:hypothetical protein